MFVKKEFLKTATLNDRTIDLLEEYLNEGIENYLTLKEKVINEKFNEFVLIMREYGIILAFHKTLFDLSKKYIQQKNF